MDDTIVWVWEQTDGYIEELEALAQAASKGPWQYRGDDWCGYIERADGIGLSIAGGFSNEGMLEDCPDTRLMVASRTAIPLLCQEVRRLRMELDKALGK